MKWEDISTLLGATELIRSLFIAWILILMFRSRISMMNSLRREARALLREMAVREDEPSKRGCWLREMAAARWKEFRQENPRVAREEMEFFNASLHAPHHSMALAREVRSGS